MTNVHGDLQNEDFESLLHLLKASKKEFVQNLIKDAFNHRSSVSTPANILKLTEETLQITPADSEKLITAITKLVKASLYSNMMERAEIHGLFPDNFHKNLRELLSKVIAENMSSWKADAVLNQVSLARLVDFSWRIDVKSASRDIARMSAPTCILQLKIDDKTEEKDGFIRHVNVELSQEKLDTILDGLWRIRDQLNSVVTR